MAGPPWVRSLAPLWKWSVLMTDWRRASLSLHRVDLSGVLRPTLCFSKSLDRLSLMGSRLFIRQKMIENRPRALKKHPLAHATHLPLLFFRQLRWENPRVRRCMQRVTASKKWGRGVTLVVYLCIYTFDMGILRELFCFLMYSGVSILYT